MNLLQIPFVEICSIGFSQISTCLTIPSIIFFSIPIEANTAYGTASSSSSETIIRDQTGGFASCLGESLLAALSEQESAHCLNRGRDLSSSV